MFSWLCALFTFHNMSQNSTFLDLFLSRVCSVYNTLPRPSNILFELDFYFYFEGVTHHWVLRAKHFIFKWNICEFLSPAHSSFQSRPCSDAGSENVHTFILLLSPYIGQLFEKSYFLSSWLIFGIPWTRNHYRFHCFKYISGRHWLQ